MERAPAGAAHDASPQRITPRIMAASLEP